MQRFDGRPQVFLCAELSARRTAKCGLGEFHLLDTYAIFMFAGLDFLMNFMDEKRNASEIHSEERRMATVHPSSGMLRRAIRENIVCFPAQIPSFLKERPDDTQWRMVLLFFVRGWSAAHIAERFNVPDHRVWKILNAWSVRAWTLGYVQVIDPEAFAACGCSDAECGTGQDTEEIRMAEVRPVFKSVLHAFPDTAPGVGARLPVVPNGAQPADPVAALDVAIAHCEEWRGEFWERTATLLRHLRTAAAGELDATRRPQGLRVRDEERVSHAVA